MPLSGDSWLLTTEGLMPLGVLAGQGQALSLRADGQAIPAVVGHSHSGPCMSYRITLANGCTLRAAEGHMLKTVSTGYKEVQDLVIGQDLVELQLGTGSTRWPGGYGTYEQGQADVCSGGSTHFDNRSCEYVLGALAALYEAAGIVDSKGAIVLFCSLSVSAVVQQALFALGIDNQRDSHGVRIAKKDGVVDFASIIGHGLGAMPSAQRLASALAKLVAHVKGMNIEDDGDDDDSDVDCTGSRVVAIEEGVFEPMFDCAVWGSISFAVNGLMVMC